MKRPAGKVGNGLQSKLQFDGVLAALVLEQGTGSVFERLWGCQHGADPLQVTDTLSNNPHRSQHPL